MKALVIIATILAVSASCAMQRGDVDSSPADERSRTLLIDASTVPSELDQLLHANAYYGRLSGTLLVAQGESVVYHRSFGYRDALSQTANTTDTIYDIGSIAKQFTAVAVMKLAEEDRLDLEARLASFFPALGAVAEQVSIHHLLSMSSGIAQDFARSRTHDIQDVVFPQPSPVTTLELVHHFGELESVFRPGNRFEYSNMNYILLAAVVEQVTGTDFHSYLSSAFFAPLGMESTAVGRHNVPTDRLARGYTGLPTSHEVPDEWHDSWLLGAGGVYSSAPDLHRWMLALERNEILSPAATEALFRPRQRYGRGHYAYGWVIDSPGGYTYRYHEGGTVGYAGEAGFYPGGEVSIVLLTNHTHNLSRIGATVTHLQGLTRQVRNILHERPFHHPPVPGDGAFALPQGTRSVAGFTYRFEPATESVTIHAEEGSPSIMDVGFLRDLVEPGRRYRRVVRVARALAEDDFRHVFWRGEWTIMMGITTKIVADAWQSLTGDKGAFVSANVYRLPSADRPYVYWVRLVNERAQTGVFITLNRLGRVRGMQIDQSFSWEGPTTIRALAIDERKLFVDGFAIGYPDLTIVSEHDRWILRHPAGDLTIE